MVRNGDGYQLNFELRGGQLDLARFDELAAAAEQARAADDPELACDLLAAALGCWRGPLLADADPSGRLRRHPAAVATSQRRFAAAVALAGLTADLGRNQHAVALLEPLAREEPLHEWLAAPLVLALAGSGEPAAALRLFADVRERLADELGIDPGDELQEAHLQVLRGEPRGTRREPSMPAPAVPMQLPADVAEFTGRSDYLKELDDLLPDGPASGPGAVVISAIAGTAGVGKPIPRQRYS